MSTLHTVNKSPFATTTLASCLNHALEGDAILLIEDGVYGAVVGTDMAKALADTKGVSLYALSGDLAARGIDTARLVKGMKPIDYAGFVALATEHDRAQAWL